MSVGAILALMWRLRKVLAIGAAVLSVWWAWHWFNGVIEERNALRAEVARVGAVNAENARVMKELKLDFDLERQATEKTLKQAAARVAASQKLIQEMRDVPGANDPAGPFWDEYARRLRRENGH